MKNHREEDINEGECEANMKVRRDGEQWWQRQWLSAKFPKKATWHLPHWPGYSWSWLERLIAYDHPFNDIILSFLVHSILVSYPDVLCPNRVCRQVFVPSLKFDGKDMPQNVWCISTVRPPITLCHGLVTVAIMPVQSCQGYPPPCMPAIYQIKNCYTH